ncbi:coiled-coil domain-containing protein 177-like [Hydractinia symbiolongicarpus]|uniref:coiled-coil domain-containing protein 177-like n=1 Tax=Hydractinia symbiolongicarpus TaxID=13093 RepID=UPI0025517913|nr:coiled-coil domain-containing protein 177-like [Hydractinia symbiolongicarpus]
MSREYPDLTPHLDLYNFTDSLAIDSRYVLTSPRSLEACARHNIKPLQLLPKTKKEFVQGLASTESYNKDLIEVMYKKSERDRLKLLRMCREERERIIDEQASHKMLQDKLLHGYEESDEESIEDIEALDTWHTLKPAERDERTPRTSTKVKPSILSFLDPESSPRFRPHISPRTYGATSNEMSAKEKTFNVLPGSDSDEDICSGRYSQRSVRIHSWKPTSATRPSSAATRKVKDLNLSDVSANLPVSLQKNLSLMSDKDRRLLEVMMSKEKEEKESRKVSLSGELNYSEEIPQMSLIHQQKLKKKEQKQINKLKEREERMNDVRLRKEAIDREAQLHREAELNVKNSKWQREYNKQMQKKTNQISDGSYYDHAEFERKKRLEHDALLNDMEDKELHAQQSFQNQMKKKRLQRDKKKIKEMERKEQQERNLKAMQKDLELWQRELAEFQNVSTKRVDNVVDSRNVSKSMKAHNKRLQKELHHLSVKAKVDEEERLRQEELRALINLKDKRSKLIQQEKEEYSNMSRGAARASRAVRDVIKEQTFRSSFAEMAAEAEKVARIEKLGQQHKKPSYLGSVSKNTTTMLLG